MVSPASSLFTRSVTTTESMSGLSAARTEIAIAVVEHRGEFLVGLRPENVALAGYWEFPGGKVQPGESAEQAAVRECREETGLDVELIGVYPAAEHDYSHDRVRLSFFRCRPLSPDTPPAPPFRWVARAELALLKFPPANENLVALLTCDPPTGA
jgi:8-oxo-dGTP diphosphatase